LRLVGFATASSRIVFVVLALVAAASSFLSLFVLQDGIDAGALIVFWAAALLSLAIVVINEWGRKPGDGRLGLDDPGGPSATMLTLQQWGLAFSLAATPTTEARRGSPFNEKRGPVTPGTPGTGERLMGAQSQHYRSGRSRAAWVKRRFARGTRQRDATRRTAPVAAPFRRKRKSSPDWESQRPPYDDRRADVPL
jgi:hypothetical protein